MSSSLKRFPLIDSFEHCFQERRRKEDFQVTKESVISRDRSTRCKSNSIPLRSFFPVETQRKQFWRNFRGWIIHGHGKLVDSDIFM